MATPYAPQSLFSCFPTSPSSLSYYSSAVPFTKLNNNFKALRNKIQKDGVLKVNHMVDLHLLLTEAVDLENPLLIENISMLISSENIPYQAYKPGGAYDIRFKHLFDSMVILANLYV